MKTPPLAVRKLQTNPYETVHSDNISRKANLRKAQSTITLNFMGRSVSVETQLFPIATLQTMPREQCAESGKKILADHAVSLGDRLVIFLKLLVTSRLSIRGSYKCAKAFSNKDKAAHHVTQHVSKIVALYDQLKETTIGINRLMNPGTPSSFIFDKPVREGLMESIKDALNELESRKQKLSHTEHKQKTKMTEVNSLLQKEHHLNLELESQMKELETLICTIGNKPCKIIEIPEIRSAILAYQNAILCPDKKSEKSLNFNYSQGDAHSYADFLRHANLSCLF